ncbi:arylesterase [Candidatus Uabimicrobium amorphum]|uniref:Arylesterase n=1 Tax=Uabimicrobium amorphum TaxID=2596890 RepID=A0A5S9IS58_UABAM|nr:arylesterase [Candidatus Uabimicrobium amorphum]BBM86924.1 arylesterase [Candidatus Uabimicrobium amorphum]
MRGIFILLFLFLLGCGGEAKRAAIGEDEVIVAFGDSLTYGVGASTQNNYPSVLGKLLDREIVASGVSGETTKQGLRRLPKVLAKYSPRILLLCLGGNDFLRKHSQKSTVANLEKMIELAQQQDIEVVLIGVPRPSIFLSTAEFYAQLAEKYNLIYEGESLERILGKQSLKADPIHPNAAGYAQMAQAIANTLRSSGLVH